MALMRAEKLRVLKPSPWNLKPKLHMAKAQQEILHSIYLKAQTSNSIHPRNRQSLLSR